MNLDINLCHLSKLSDQNKEVVKAQISDLATQISSAQKQAVIAVSMPIFDEKKSRIFETLGAVLIRASELKLNYEMKVQLGPIKSLYYRMVCGNSQHQVSSTDNTATLLNPADIQNCSAEKQIEMINQGLLSLSDFFPGRTGSEIVDLIIKNPACQQLTYANFDYLGSFISNVGYFDNECLEKLTLHCPNLEYLSSRGAKIQWDALRHLRNVPNLKTLNIDGCDKLDHNFFHYLEEVQKLQILSMGQILYSDNYDLQFLSHIPDLKNLNLQNSIIPLDSLKYLKNVPGLEHLNIEGCGEIELDYLRFAPQLKSLNIACNSSLESDCLKNLKYVPLLTSLNIYACPKLQPNSLEHLQYTPNLLELNMYHCVSLAPDSLKYLKHTSKLQKLNISTYKTRALGIRKLESDSLKYLEYTPDLISLSLKWSDDLAPDSLKYLEKTPKLQTLDMDGFRSLESDALRYLIYTPGLLHLDVSCSKYLERKSLKYLFRTPKLRTLEMRWSKTLSRNSLRYLKYTPELQSLDISHNTHNLDRTKLPENLRWLL